MHAPVAKQNQPESHEALLTVLRSAPPVRGTALRSVAAQCAASGGSPGYALVILLMVGLLLGVVIAGLMFGSVHIPGETAVAILANLVAGDGLVEPGWRAVYETIVVQTRMPRVVLAALVGASLGVTGMTIQSIVRNPLAGPGILGISSGAATGAVVVMRWGFLGLGVFTLHISAFLGGLITLFAVFWVARTGGFMTPTRLVLAGVAMSAILSALTSLIVLTSPDPQLASRVLFWTLGGFGTAQWKLIPIPLAALAIGLGVMLVQARRLNLLMAGDESAVALGLNVQRFRQSMFVLAAALTGITVAVAGVIGFVGLIMPHIVRFLVGADHRRALPAVALLGASFTIGADLVARTVIAPLELPVGIVTALVGGPFFIWLLRRDARGLGGAR
ncbi:FecCD family ABC transporter permease [Nitratireductor sp. L15S-10]|uniref:FecCD family ABC transporter permease n=1 Tax=Nitratireductor sp. L15S-10 TaxID=3034028 RepID=UPI003857A06A